MSWWTYVERVAQTTRQRDIAERTGIDETNVTRWKVKGQVPKPPMVRQFALAYGQPVLDAFVEAGFLTRAEAGVVSAGAPSLDSLTDDELLDEIRQRLSQRGARDDASQEQGPQAGGSAQQSEASIAGLTESERIRLIVEYLRDRGIDVPPESLDPTTDQPDLRPVSDSDGRTTDNKRAEDGGRR